MDAAIKMDLQRLWILGLLGFLENGGGRVLSKLGTEI